MRKVFIAVFLMLIIYGRPAYAEIPIGEVVFDCNYVNYAWGYRLEGFYVDRVGNMYKYNRNKLPWLPESEKKGSAHPEVDLLDKYHNKEMIGKINKTTLEKKISLIQDSASGVITRKSRGNDIGSKGCVAYLFNEHEKTYKEVNLGSTGDVDEENSSSSAQVLLQWLNQFWQLTRSSSNNSMQ